MVVQKQVGVGRSVDGPESIFTNVILLGAGE